MPNTIHTGEYKEIIERLKEARIEAGLSQKEVADKLKKSQSYISKIEAGEQRIDILEMKKFADLYKRPLNYFMK